MTIHFLYCWKYDVSLHLVFKLFFVTPRKTITTSMNCARVWGDRGVKSPSPSHQDPGYASRLCFKVQGSLFKDRFGKILLDLGNNSSLAKVRKIPFLLNEKVTELKPKDESMMPMYTIIQIKRHHYFADCCDMVLAGIRYVWCDKPCSHALLFLRSDFSMSSEKKCALSHNEYENSPLMSNYLHIHQSTQRSSKYQQELETQVGVC